MPDLEDTELINQRKGLGLVNGFSQKRMEIKTEAWGKTKMQPPESRPPAEVMEDPTHLTPHTLPPVQGR